MSIIILVTIYFFLRSCSAGSNGTLCPDIVPDCADSLDFCNMSLIRTVCPTSCEAWNTTTCISTSKSCEFFDFLGPAAFIGYGIVFFLLIIIWVLAYSLCIDPKPLKRSIQRFSRKKAKKRDAVEVKPFVGAEAELMVMNPNSLYISSTVSNPVRDIQLSYQSRPSYKVEEEKEPMYLQPRSKVSFALNKVDDEAEGFFDPEDDFFKHHALLAEDTTELEPPLPPRIGAPRLSSTLSNIALLKAERESASDAAQNQNISRESLSAPFGSVPNLNLSTPKVLQDYNQRLASKLSNHTSSNSRAMGDIPRETRKDSGERKLLGEPSIPETLSPLNSYALEAVEGGASDSIFHSTATSSGKVDRPKSVQRNSPPKYGTPTEADKELLFQKRGFSASVEGIVDEGEDKAAESDLNSEDL